MILVSGLINLETTLRIDAFPLHYNPVNYPFFGVKSTISGVGLNVAKALTTLGTPVHFLSLIGQDLAGNMVLESLKEAGIDALYIVRGIDETAQSVIIYEKTGKRQIHVDLKNLQETPYPVDLFEAAILDCSVAVLCNINFSRPFLQRAKQMGKLVATDVHELSNLEDSYNRDFMTAADILFLSHGSIPTIPATFIRQIYECYHNPVIVMGLGEQGSLLATDGKVRHFPSISIRPVVNTIGAGDALFSAFVHFYAQNSDPFEALHRATYFASYKIGARGAADGFLDEPSLLELVKN